MKLPDNPDNHEIAAAVNGLSDKIDAEFQTVWAKMYELEADVKKLLTKPKKKTTTKVVKPID